MKKIAFNIIKSLPLALVFSSTQAAEKGIWDGFIKDGDIVEVSKLREGMECPDENDIDIQLKVISKLEHTRFLWLDLVPRVGDKDVYIVRGGIKESTPPEIVKELASNYKFAWSLSCSLRGDA